MRLRGRQLRFVLGSIGGWAAARGIGFWSGGAALGVGTIVGVAALTGLLSDPHPIPRPPFVAARAPAPPPPRRSAPPAPARVAAPGWLAPERSAQLLPLALTPYYQGSPQALLRRASFAPEPAPRAEAAAPPAVPRPSDRSAPPRWSGSFYAFVRAGQGGPSLAAGGQLGGSQAAGRIAYRIDRRASLATRLYTPLHGKGAEAAAGLEWEAAPGALRLVLERRIGLDGWGRDAWSAYAAGGLYREPLPGLVVDGYAQAGVVGARRRDAFADGALRVGRRLAIGSGALVVGAGLWGAAQPGVSRLDAGPRLAASLPVAGKTLGLAVEGRFRVAGRARPGSGVALTLGVDF